MPKIAGMKDEPAAMEEPLSPPELRVYRQRLLRELAAHAAEVADLEQGALEPSGGSRFQDIDEAIEEASLETDLDALAAEDRLGYEVREALERIADETFGLCESCGEQITRQRLNLVPYARLCVRCALRAEAG